MPSFCLWFPRPFTQQDWPNRIGESGPGIALHRMTAMRTLARTPAEARKRKCPRAARTQEGYVDRDNTNEVRAISYLSTPFEDSAHPYGIYWLGAKSSDTQGETIGFQNPTAKQFPLRF